MAERLSKTRMIINLLVPETVVKTTLNNDIIRRNYHDWTNQY